jgi:pyruvate dehydrogenase E1 component beta subunit
MLYATTGDVPLEDYIVDIGKADIKKEGEDVTIVAVSKMVQDAFEASVELEKDGISTEIVDPRSLKPLDMETISSSVKKTGKVVIVNEAFRTGSVASDIGIQIQEECFDYLDAPVLRVTAPDVQPPYAKPLEKIWLPGKDAITDAVKKLVSD